MIQIPPEIKTQFDALLVKKEILKNSLMLPVITLDTLALAQTWQNLA
jgi:hypothetical protein